MLKTFVKLEHLNLLSEMDFPEENFERKDMRVEFIDLMYTAQYHLTRIIVL